MRFTVTAKTKTIVNAGKMHEGRGAEAQKQTCNIASGETERGAGEAASPPGRSF